MDRSFVTRFRRHLAKVPFVIVFLIPVGVAGVFYADAQRDDDVNLLTPPVRVHVEIRCLDIDPLERTLEACPEHVQGAE